MLIIRAADNSTFLLSVNINNYIGMLNVSQFGNINPNLKVSCLNYC